MPCGIEFDRSPLGSPGKISSFPAAPQVCDPLASSRCASMNGLRPAARVPSIKRGFGLDTITPSVEVDLGLLCRHGKEDDARIESKRTLRRDRLVSTKSGLCKKAVDSFRQKPKNCLLIQSHRGKLSTNFRQGQHQTEQN